MTLKDLILEVATHETLLKNVWATGTSKTEHLAEDGTWHLRSSATVTDVYEGEPEGKFRDELDAIVPWHDGPAPFAQEVSITAFNGRVKQVLTLKEGVPDDTHKQPARGQIEGERGDSLGRDASGWGYSLYGARPQRMSAWLEALAGRKDVQVLVSQVREADVLCWQATVNRRGHKSEVWWFDPGHGYAIRRHEVWSPDGTLKTLFTVDKIIEAAPGVFYPTNVTAMQVWSGQAAALMHRSGQERTQIQVSHVKANIPDLSDDMFSVQWPEGTRVEDKVAGTTYVVKKEH